MALQTDYDLIFTECLSGGCISPRFCRECCKLRPASVIMVLDHRERTKDQIETIQLRRLFTSAPRLLISCISAIFRGRDFIDQHCSQMKVLTAFRNLRAGCRTSVRLSYDDCSTRRRYMTFWLLLCGLTREQLLKVFEVRKCDRRPDVYIRYLRRQLDVTCHIKTVRGVESYTTLIERNRVV